MTLRNQADDSWCAAIMCLGCLLSLEGRPRSPESDPLTCIIMWLHSLWEWPDIYIYIYPVEKGRFQQTPMWRTERTAQMPQDAINQYANFSRDYKDLYRSWSRTLVAVILAQTERKKSLPPSIWLRRVLVGKHRGVNGFYLGMWEGTVGHHTQGLIRKGGLSAGRLRVSCHTRELLLDGRSG